MKVAQMKPLLFFARLLVAILFLAAAGCGEPLTPVDPAQLVGTWAETDLPPPPATGWYVFEHQVRFGSDGSFTEWVAQSNATPGAIPPTAFSNEFTGTWELRGDRLTTTADGTKVRRISVGPGFLTMDSSVYEVVQ